jgi:hypothetical protein
MFAVHVGRPRRWLVPVLHHTIPGDPVRIRASEYMGTGLFLDAKGGGYLLADGCATVALFSQYFFAVGYHAAAARIVLSLSSSLVSFPCSLIQPSTTLQ